MVKYETPIMKDENRKPLLGSPFPPSVLWVKKILPPSGLEATRIFHLTF
jgi:hypothetical protein